MRIHVKLPLGEVRDRVRLLGAMLSGRVVDSHGIGKSFSTAIGVAALGSIREAFVTKARGGTDALGIKWPPLKPETISRRRVGPGDTRAPKRGSKADVIEAASRSFAIKQRERIRKREYRKSLKSLLLKLPEPEAQRRAAQIAGQIATRRTGKTRVRVLGGRDVEILRDTGVLLNSLTPGELVGEQYAAPDDQVFEASAGRAVVGSSVVYANTHDRGDPSRNIPRRQILPDEGQTLPQQWTEDWADAGERVLISGLSRLLAA